MMSYRLLLRTPQMGGLRITLFGLTGEQIARYAGAYQRRGRIKSVTFFNGFIVRGISPMEPHDLRQGTPIPPHWILIARALITCCRID